MLIPIFEKKWPNSKKAQQHAKNEEEEITSKAKQKQMGHKSPKKKERKKEIKPSELVWQKMVVNRPTDTIRDKNKVKQKQMGYKSPKKKERKK